MINMIQCPECGTQNPDDSLFCKGCGIDLRVKTTQMKRPFEITKNALLWFFIGSICMIASAIGIFFRPSFVHTTFLLLPSLGLLFLVTASGLWKGKSWSYVPSYFCASSIALIILYDFFETFIIEKNLDKGSMVGDILVLLYVIMIIADLRKPHVREYLKIGSK